MYSSLCKFRLFVVACSGNIPLFSLNAYLHERNLGLAVCTVGFGWFALYGQEANVSFWPSFL